MRIHVRRRRATRTLVHKRGSKSGPGGTCSLCGGWRPHRHVAATVPVSATIQLTIIRIYHGAYRLCTCRSEGPAQVFLIVLVWLLSALGHLPRRVWKNTIIAYDNMCHLDNLSVAKKPLPIPGPQKYIWQDVRKTIDCLHIRNHKDK